MFNIKNVVLTPIKESSKFKTHAFDASSLLVTCVATAAVMAGVGATIVFDTFTVLILSILSANSF